MNKKTEQRISKMLYPGCAIIIVLLLLCEFIPTVKMHAAAWWQIPGYHAVIGFLIGLIWVKSVKWLGKHGLQIPEEAEDE